MAHPRRYAVLVLLAASVCGWCTPAAANTLRPAACHTSFDARGAVCGTLTAPVDRSGQVAGRTSLFVERVRAHGRSKGAVALFPGGPGLSASLIAREIAPRFMPLLGNRDLILFDQRGTGRSGFLDCNSALDPTYFVPVGLESQQEAKTVERCANSLGAKRSFYTSADTVADFEQVRAALGIDRVALIGVSYGTRDAMEYARAYPQHVESLVLDSVVADPGPEPMGVASLRAVARVLRQQCAGGACGQITTDPAADLERLVAKLDEGAIRSHRLLGRPGCHASVPITRSELWGVISEADFDPELLSELPVAIAAAANGDPYQLSELVAESYSDRVYQCLPPPEPKGPRPKLPKDFREFGRLVFSSGEQIARICEDNPMPWSNDAPVTERRRLFEEGFAQLPDSAFLPFDRATAMGNVLAPLCKYWPRGHRSQVVAGGPLPTVPTLIVSGLDDLRTPTEDAVALAQANPGARLLLVPNQGHSALGTPCASRALTAFMAAQPVADCRITRQHVPAPAHRVRPYWG